MDQKPETETATDSERVAVVTDAFRQMSTADRRWFFAKLVLPWLRERARDGDARAVEAVERYGGLAWVREQEADDAVERT